MTAIAIIWLFVALQLKHFIVDFPMQVPYMYKNKGTYMHPGGLLHSGLHALFTFTTLVYFLVFIGITGWLGFLVPLYIATLEFILHYHIDWGKVQINKRTGWGMTTHEEFWWLLGFDQLLHQLTYIAIVTVLVLLL